MTLAGMRAIPTGDVAGGVILLLAAALALPLANIDAARNAYFDLLHLPAGLVPSPLAGPMTVRL